MTTLKAKTSAISLSLLFAFQNPGEFNAENFSKKFNVGQGAKYTLSLQGLNVSELLISVASSSKSKISIEYFMGSENPLSPLKLWQQFEIKIPKKDGEKLEVTKGYIMSQEMTAPEEISINTKQKNGLILDDFLLSAKNIRKLPYTDEITEVPAGKIKSRHYVIKRDKQTLHFWISSEVMPIGLVKLKSTGDTPVFNYEISLGHLINDLKPSIDPKKAKPLSKNGEAWLKKMKILP